MRKFFVGLVGIAALGILSGCDAKDSNGVSLSKYVPGATIQVSPDATRDSWSENIKQLQVGETFYIRITVAVKGKTRDISYFISIPNTEVADIILQDADGRVQSVPISDVLSGDKRYQFKAISSRKKPKPMIVQFQCNPLAVGSTKIELSYAESLVSDTYWKTRTLVYIDTEE